MRQVICDYCGCDARLVDGATVYPHRRDLKDLKYWYCDNGHEPAYVGCHRRSTTHAPFGRLANTHLRGAKSRAHEMFDPLWHHGSMSRKEAYQWLAKQLGIDFKDCHIGYFDAVTCLKVCEIMKKQGVANEDKQG